MSRSVWFGLALPTGKLRMGLGGFCLVPGFKTFARGPGCGQHCDSVGFGGPRGGCGWLEHAQVYF